MKLEHLTNARLDRRSMLGLGCGLLVAGRLPAAAQEPGVLMPHVGAQMTTAFSNKFGPDAEATTTIAAVSPEMLSLQYASTRGLRVARNILAADRQSARVYVLGYAESMPLMIPGSTSLGISGEVLRELRGNGRTSLSLIYDAKMSRIDGTLQLVANDVRVPLIIENQVANVPAVRAQGTFQTGDRTGRGDFVFLDNQHNPLMIESNIQFNFENQVRLERIVKITAGASMRSAMEQSLATVRKYEIYGLHFAFDQATLLPEGAHLIRDIATTLQNNPTWTLQINGHTDSIGDPAYNLRLSAERAASVAGALERQGISPTRLTTAGLGETQPKADNSTMEGRALNRRVELVRTDR